MDQVREDRKAAREATNEAVKRHWVGELPKARVAVPQTREEMMLYSLDDYMEGDIF